MSFANFKRIVEEGDTVILYIGLLQIYALEVKPNIKNRHGEMVEYTFQTKYGALRVMDLIGKEFGSKIQLTKGYAYALYPTPELWTLTLPHRTQILYTPDISLIIMELEVRAGSIVCEAGTGSGSLSHAILRAIGSSGHLYTCDFHKERVEMARSEFDRHGLNSSVTVEVRDVCEHGWNVTGLADAVFLDLPKPWDALPHAVRAIRSRGGRICSFSPCVEQVCRSSDMMRSLGLKEVNTVECLQREFQFRSIVLPSVSCKKVPASLISKNQKSAETKVKIQKVTPSDEEKLNSYSTHTETKSIEEDTVNSSTNSCEDVKLRTAVPMLKMPGHTGFLTFATVPPMLSCSSRIIDLTTTSVNSTKIINQSIDHSTVESADSVEIVHDASSCKNICSEVK